MEIRLFLNNPYSTDGKHKACGPNPALHLVLSSPAPCFYLVAALSSRLTIKEYLHLYSPKITFGPLKASNRKADVALRENEFNTLTRLHE